MNVVIRTDSSTAIGTGHVMRCLTLADQLTKQGASVLFVCRDLPGSIIEEIRRRGYPVHGLAHAGDAIVSTQKTDEYAQWLVVSKKVDMVQTRRVLENLATPCDWLIVDHYALDKEWESGLRKHAGQIMVIDDLANREHDCDLLLDQNFYEDQDSRYNGLVSDNCRLLLGPRYGLIREEFRVVCSSQKRATGQCRRILVFFGGVDATNQTGKALGAIEKVKHTKLQYDIVAGAANPHWNELSQRAERRRNVNLRRHVDNMAEFMAQADLSVGAGGTTTFERLYLGLPTIAVSAAENQVKSLEDLSRHGFLKYLGRAESVTSAMLAEAIDEFVNEPFEVPDYEFATGDNVLWSELQNSSVHS